VQSVCCIGVWCCVGLPGSWKEYFFKVYIGFLYWRQLVAVTFWVFLLFFQVKTLILHFSFEENNIIEKQTLCRQFDDFRSKTTQYLNNNEDMNKNVGHIRRVQWSKLNTILQNYQNNSFWNVVRVDKLVFDFAQISKRQQKSKRKVLKRLLSYSWKV